MQIVTSTVRPELNQPSVFSFYLFRTVGHSKLCDKCVRSLNSKSINEAVL